MSSIFQRLFGPVQSEEQGKTMQSNIMDDEIPIDDPDELAVEEEFKKRATLGGKTVTEEAPVVRPPVQRRETVPVREGRNAPVDNRPKPQKPSVQGPEVSLPPAAPPPAVPRQNPPQRPPQPPPQTRPQQSRTPVQSDINQLQTFAKSKGLKTSMDSIDEQGDMMFDIEVMETGEDGRPMVHVERGVSASSERELHQLYAMSDQKINIIRRYGGGNELALPPTQSSPQPPPRNLGSQTPAAAPAPAVEQPKEPPKFFNVSGVECKLENGKVYQRQWVRLAGADAEAFRLVNDSNNKIVPIDGKHIEQKKWVLIQENVEEGD